MNFLSNFPNDFSVINLQEIWNISKAFSIPGYQKKTKALNFWTLVEEVLHQLLDLFPALAMLVDISMAIPILVLGT